MDDDDLLGPSVPAHADSMGLDLEDNEDLLGSDGAAPLLDDDDDFLSSDPTPSKSESANGQKAATNQAMIDNANEAMRLEELNKKMEQKKEQFKVLLASLRVQVEALKPTASNHDPKSLQTQIRALRAEIESHPAVIERMRKVQDMARKKIDSLDSELQNLREERKHDLEKNRSERENADMMKYTQAMQLQKNAFKREIEAMTVVAEKYEEYVEKITPFASNPTEYCTQADILINNLTDLFYKERDEKNAFKKESAEIEQSIQTLRESYEKVSEELKVKRREVLKKTMEIREKGAGASGASDRKDFADMIGNIDDDDISNAPANDSVEKDDDDLLDTDGPPVAAVPTSDGLESDEDLF